MNLDQFIANKKRMTQYGNPSNASDQAAKDVLASINDRLDEIAKNWLWDWLYEPFTITLLSGTSEYTLPSGIRKIIYMVGSNGPVDNITHREYLDFKYGVTNAIPSWYMYYGRDASGDRKILIGGIPSSSTELDALGKLKLTRFATSDLGGAESMLPFPEEGEGVLGAFVEADIYRLQGKKDLIFPQEKLAKEKLKEWRGEETTEPASRAKTNLPNYLRIKRQNRRNGHVV